VIWVEELRLPFVDGRRKAGGLSEAFDENGPRIFLRDRKVNKTTIKE